MNFCKLEKCSTPVVVILLLGVTVTLTVFHMARNATLKGLKETFRTIVADREVGIRGILQSNLAALQAMQIYYDVSPLVT